MVSLRFLPSTFLLLSILKFSVVETLKGPSVRLSEISSIAAAATEITFVLPSFRPALQPISEGSPIDGETDRDRPCPSLLPFLSSSVTCLFGLLCSIHSTGQDSVQVHCIPYIVSGSRSSVPFAVFTRMRLPKRAFIAAIRFACVRTLIAMKLRRKPAAFCPSLSVSLHESAIIV